MHYVSIAIHKGNPVISPNGLLYVRALANVLNGRGLSPWLGRDAGFERNYAATSEGLRHCHIRLAGIDEPWPASQCIPNKRVSDNFLIYATHWLHPNYHQALMIVQPEAHRKIDSLLPLLTEHVKHCFSTLSEHELRQLQNISS